MTYPGVDDRVATESGASDTFDQDAWMPVCFLNHTALYVALDQSTQVAKTHVTYVLPACNAHAITMACCFVALEYG